MRRFAKPLYAQNVYRGFESPLSASPFLPILKIQCFRMSSNPTEREEGFGSRSCLGFYLDHTIGGELSRSFRLIQPPQSGGGPCC